MNAQETAALEALDREQFTNVDWRERGLAVMRGRTHKQIDRLLQPARQNRDNQSVAAHLARHRGQLLTFPTRAGIEATHWLFRRRSAPP